MVEQAHITMAAYLLSSTDAPFGMNCEEIADAVFERMKTPEAINDLTLPEPTQYVWAAATPTVRIVFTMQTNSHRVCDSYTSTDSKSGETVCRIFYTALELAECPDIIRSRFAHQITHGIRTTLIRSTVELHELKNSSFCNSTPPRHPRDRLFKSRFLAHMDSRDNCFEGGYWMEHFAFGGILVSLTGCFFTKRMDPEGSKVVLGHRTNAYFRLIALGYSIHVGEETFTQLVGYLYDKSTRAFGPKTEIFHSFQARFCRSGLDRVVTSDYW